MIVTETATKTYDLTALYGRSNVKQTELHTKEGNHIRLGIKPSRRVADQIENELSRTSDKSAGKMLKSK